MTHFQANSNYNNLLKKAGTTTKNKQLQNIILVILKCIHFVGYVKYLRDTLHLCSSNYFLFAFKPFKASHDINNLL